MGTSIFFFILMALLALAGNIIWYWLKSDLNKHGYKTHMFYGHLDDIFNAKEVIRTTKDDSLRVRYKKVLNWLFVVIFIFVCGGLTAFLTNNKFGSSRQTTFEKLLEDEFSGQITDKYIDSTNHMYKYIEITESGTSKKINLTLYQNLYTNTEIGNHISKAIGDSTIYLNQNGLTKTITLIRSRYLN